MERTIADNQELILKEKIKEFFIKSGRMNTTDFCPIRDVLSKSLDQWSLFVIYNLGYNKVMRFNELKKRIDGISSRMLSTTLKKLEGNNMISRIAYAEVPPRVEYRLTSLGKDFADKIIDLSQWYLENYDRKT